MISSAMCEAMGTELVRQVSHPVRRQTGFAN